MKSFSPHNPPLTKSPPNPKKTAFKTPKQKS
ncbi:hypothetical protein N203_07695 [Helicobacter pylori UM084]|nr:hypothetical protein N203_07695 [Helicobacter pylori UM084]